VVFWGEAFLGGCTKKNPCTYLGVWTLITDQAYTDKSKAESPGTEIIRNTLA